MLFVKMLLSVVPSEVFPAKQEAKEKPTEGGRQEEVEMQGRAGAGRLLLSTALWLAGATAAVQWIIVGASAGDPGPPPRPPWADRQRGAAPALGPGLGRLGLPQTSNPAPGSSQAPASVAEPVTGTA